MVEPGPSTPTYGLHDDILASQFIYVPRRPTDESLNSHQPREQQKPLNLPVMPPSDSNPDPHHPPAQGTVILSDVMSRDKSINIFAGLAQDIDPVTLRLDDSNKNTTVLAPLNSAVESLPRKPWEDPYEYNNLGADAYQGDEGRERARRNLRRFVEAHLVPQSPWGENEKVKTIDGDREVWWESRDGTKFIQPDNIEVVSVASAVANGEIWIVKDVRNYSQRP
ncbi:hypothetical protein SODALDRAFT_374686 [Sodiomyces alkalinus F11]|uniref:FAS1 domain-containing protein n=1 Tax=Sodiomyces alkalinus (strain CBS 110278 / VKM F-3762 / F11) TaxID=1314773 RepID=A0A3N2Q6P8_SODAK|nr:hypothetical protein SODALDRAFT_374686 [Sodiomyces alkalinus F11]ROT42338.1 hypothetical protein SODALDRAFT_374686 [Sodiomyces alkalinus F11]